MQQEVFEYNKLSKAVFLIHKLPFLFPWSMLCSSVYNTKNKIKY